MHLRSPMTTLTLTLVLASCGGAPVKPAPPVERPVARTDAGGAAPAPTAYVDADSCPHPPSGQFEPRRMVAFETAVRDMFFANYKGDPVLFAVVQPSFDMSFLVSVDRRIERKRDRRQDHKPDGKAISGGRRDPFTQDGFSFEPPPRPDEYRYELRVIRATRHVWADMWRRLERRHGGVIRLDEENQKAALPAKPPATTERRRELDRATAEKLMAVWQGVLRRTRHVELLQDPASGEQVLTQKVDGTFYDLWADGKSAGTHSPAKGSLLAELVDVIEALARNPGQPSFLRDRHLRDIEARAVRLLARLAKNESCLKRYENAP